MFVSELKQHSKAIDYYERAAQHALEHNQDTEALEYFRAAIRSQLLLPEQPISRLESNHLHLAESLYSKGAHDDALEQTRHAISLCDKTLELSEHSSLSWTLWRPFSMPGLKEHIVSTVVGPLDTPHRLANLMCKYDPFLDFAVFFSICGKYMNLLISIL